MPPTNDDDDDDEVDDSFINEGGGGVPQSGCYYNKLRHFAGIYTLEHNIM